MAMFDIHDLPASRGAYVLHLSVASAQRISVGRLGHYHFSAGDYFYVGSAHGAGGLRARIGRHLRGAGTRHWHIDYLRAIADVHEVFYTVTDESLECAWSHALARLPRASIPAPHFGAGDCRSGCVAHLIAFPPRTHLTAVPRILEQAAHMPIAYLSNK